MFQLPDLNYSYDGLEPYISSETVDAHYNLHHQGYVDKLNQLLLETNYQGKPDLVWIIEHIDELPKEKRDQILYNAMAVSNHDLYWLSMNPKHRLPSDALKEQIEKQYGSYEQFQKEFIRVAKTLVGSGYTFLVIDRKGDLIIMNTTNQDSPYLYGFTPILTMDLWEHSYYLDYLNRRNEYIDNFFRIVDFNDATKKYKDIQKKL